MFSRVAIIGLGLMGGSLALALRAAGVADHIAGYDRATEPVELAHARGIIDEGFATAEAAVASAELVVLATPALASRDLLRAIAPHLAPGVVVTDVASTKRSVVAWARELLPERARFVGGHPMAGSERSGLEASDAALFAGAVWCLTPDGEADRDCVEKLSALVTALGASPVVLDAARHDHLVAGVSHMPILIAAALVRTVAGGGEWPEALRLAAGGFRDGSRVASGDPRMARDICLTNADEIVEWLDRYLASLQEVRGLIVAAETGADVDGALEGYFRAQRDARDAWLRAISL